MIVLILDKDRCIKIFWFNYYNWRYKRRIHKYRLNSIDIKTAANVAKAVGSKWADGIEMSGSIKTIEVR